MDIGENIDSFNSFYKFVKDVYKNGFKIFINHGDNEKSQLFMGNPMGEESLLSEILCLSEESWGKFNIKAHYDELGIPVKLTLGDTAENYKLETEYAISYGISVVASGLKWKKRENETLDLPTVLFASVIIHNEALIHEECIPIQVTAKIIRAYNRLLENDIPHIEKCERIYGMNDNKIMNMHINDFEYSCQKHGYIKKIK